MLVLELAIIDRFGVEPFLFASSLHHRSLHILRIFFQGKDESVVINDEITVTVLDIDGDEVTLAIDAPEWMEIDVKEASQLEDEVEEWSLLRPR